MAYPLIEPVLRRPRSVLSVLLVACGVVVILLSAPLFLRSAGRLAPGSAGSARRHFDITQVSRLSL